MTRELLNPSFLRQYKTDLEQYPVTPVSTGKMFTHQSLDPVIVFKAKYLLLLALRQDSMFPLEWYVISTRKTFLKLFETMGIPGSS